LQFQFKLLSVDVDGTFHTDRSQATAKESMLWWWCWWKNTIKKKKSELL
jgi:hypothetical protein